MRRPVKFQPVLQRTALLGCTLLAALWICACDSSNASSSKPQQAYGTLSLAIEFLPAAASPRGPNAAAPDVCADYGIDTIAAQVLDSDNQEVASASWRCGLHKGEIKDVPSGTDYTVVCAGKIHSQSLWQGTSEQVSVTAGQTTRPNPIAMHYIGNDSTSPALSYSYPADSESGVALNTVIVTAFNEPLAASSIPDQAISVTAAGNPVAGGIIFHPGNRALFFQPAEPLQPLTVYSVTLDASLPDGAGITDAAGNACSQDYHWNFTTGDSMDTKAPQVTATTPADGADGVDPYDPVSATFDEPLNPADLPPDLFIVTSGGSTVAGAISYDHLTHTVIFTPNEPLDYLTDYSATVQAGVTDLARNPLPEPSHTWTFRTVETQHALSVVKQGTGNGIITSTPAGIDCGSNCNARFRAGAQIALLAVPDQNSQFAGWSEPACDNTACNISLLQDTTVTATFSLKTHVIEAKANTGGTVSPSGSIVVSRNEDANFRFTTYDGYYFADLMVDGVSYPPSDAYDFLQVQQNHTIEAIFKPVILVDNQVQTSGNGQTWATAVQSIQEAINGAAAGDEIWVSEGDYLVSTPIVVDRPLTIRGGFNKTETYLQDRTPPRRTFINGNEAVGCMRITAEAFLDHFVFINGTSGNGGALNCTAPATLENCTFSNCIADDGGAIYSIRRINLLNCDFINDQSRTGGSGGAIFIQGTASQRAGMILRGCRFDNNMSLPDDHSQGGLFGGGAIFSNYSDALIIADSTFSENWAVHGGAVYIVNGDTAAIQDCQFDSNNARVPAGMGGAIYIKDCLLQISGSTFSNNTGFDGGAIFAHPSPRTSHGISSISRSVLHNNSDGNSVDGAAIRIVEGKFRIFSSLFYANRGYCAGVVCAEGEVTLNVVNSTFTDNNGSVGAISGGNTTVVNSILWGNRSDSGNPDTTQVSTGMNVQYSDIDQVGFEGIGGNIRVTPGFADAANKNYRLADGSQCIDSGNDSAMYLPVEDLDGRNRIIGQGVDMGAYEKP